MGARPCACVDRICPKRSWEALARVTVMVAVGVNDDYCEVAGAAEGFAESAKRRRELLSWSRRCGLRNVRMFAGNRAAGMVGSIAWAFPDEGRRRSTIHFHSNAPVKAPESKRPHVAAMR